MHQYRIIENVYTGKCRVLREDGQRLTLMAIVNSREEAATLVASYTTPRLAIV